MPVVFGIGSTSSESPNLLGGLSTILGGIDVSFTNGYIGRWTVDAYSGSNTGIARYIDLNPDEFTGANKSYLKLSNTNGNSLITISPNILTVTASYIDMYSSGSMSISSNLYFHPSTGKSGGSYFGSDGFGTVFAGSQYMFFNQSASTYFTGGIVARGGISQDQAAYLTLTGGSLSDTYVVGNLGIGVVPSASFRLNILGGGINLQHSGTFTNEFKSSSGGTNIVTFDLSNVSSEDYQLRMAVNGSEGYLEASTGATQTYGLALTSPRYVRIGPSDNIYINSSGNVAMGSSFTNSNAKLHIRGTSIVQNDFALKVADSGQGPLLSVRNDGVVLFATSSAGSGLQITPVVDSATNTMKATSYQAAVHGTFSDNAGGRFFQITGINLLPSSISCTVDCMVSALAGATAGGLTASTRFIHFNVVRNRGTVLAGSASVTVLSTGGTNSTSPASLDINTITVQAVSASTSLTVNLVIDIVGTLAVPAAGTILTATGVVRIHGKGIGVSNNLAIVSGL